MVLVHCNYIEDLRSLLVAKLIADGFKAEPSDDVDALLIRYLNVEQRRIRQLPRSVHWSKELQSKRGSIPAPLRRGIASIEKAAVKGEDLNPYLSRQLIRKKDADSSDPQFNDWGMKHMHLGEVFESPGVVKGTKEILFVIVRDDGIYFIDVGKHGDWTDDGLFAVVETNWPELFAHAVLKNVSGGPTWSPAARAKMHKKFVITTTGPSGQIYGPIGGGAATSGLNFHLRRAADGILNRIHRLEEAHKAQGDQIAPKLAQKGGKTLTEVHLKLESIDEDDEVIVREIQTNTRIASSMRAVCRRCGLVAGGLRSAITSEGWKKQDARAGWVCPRCLCA